GPAGCAEASYRRSRRGLAVDARRLQLARPIECEQPRRGLCEDLPEDDFEVAGEPLDRRTLEEVRVVQELARDSLVGDVEVERQVEGGETGIDANTARRRPGQLGLCRRLHPNSEVHLREGVDPRIAAGTNGIDHVFEGHFLVLERTERGLAHPAEELAE